MALVGRHDRLKIEMYTDPILIRPYRESQSDDNGCWIYCVRAIMPFVNGSVTWRNVNIQLRCVRVGPRPVFCLSYMISSAAFAIAFFNSERVRLPRRDRRRIPREKFAPVGGRPPFLSLLAPRLLLPGTSRF